MVLNPSEISGIDLKNLSTYRGLDHRPAESGMRRNITEDAAGTYITTANVAKSEMTEYSVADLGWFSFSWQAFGT